MGSIGTVTGAPVRNIRTMANGGGEERVLRGENPMKGAGVGQNHTNTVDVTHEDAASIGSYGSNRMIIQKETGWNVESAEMGR